MAGRGAVAGVVPAVREEEVERLSGRIAVLLQETAHQGILALRLLVQARELLSRVGATDDQVMRSLIEELEERLIALEHKGQERLREARRLLRAHALRR
jgi:hypothetical protein